MRNKRLIILLSVLGGVVVLIVVMSIVFTVYHIEARCIGDYSPTQNEEISRTSEEIVAAADDFMYRSIFLFDEDELAAAVDANVVRAEVRDVVCIFPNKVRIDYGYVSDDIQVRDEASGNYIIAGASGKITSLSGNDMSSPEDSSVISVVLPDGHRPVGSVPGAYMFNEDSFERKATETFVRYAESLKENGEDSGRVFRAAYKQIDLSDALKDAGATITVTLRSGFEFVINGSLNLEGENFTFDDEDTLQSAVNAMVSFYHEEEDGINGGAGVATVQYSEGSFKVAFDPDAGDRGEI